MLDWLIYGMIYLGSALMVYNIIGFIRYARYVKGQENWGKEAYVLHVPIFLLVMFLLGYLAVGLFGRPDLIVSAILFGGSVFVFLIYILFSRITRRIIQSERVAAELRAAELGSREKSSFLASISHEMRTPMNAILGMSNIALRNPGLPAETRGQLEKIDQSGKYLLALINKTLDLQSINAGDYRIQESAFSLREMTGQVDVIAKALCEEKGLTYVSRVAEGAEGRYIGDMLLIRQALLNLLDNAVKYTPAPGTVSFSVESVFRNGEVRTLRFTVSDTGIGMSPEFLDKAFEVFTKEDASSTSRYGGSGLSLAITRQQVVLMGGTISATSVQNEGSVFTVMLPLKQASGEETGEEAEADNAAETEGESLSGKRILIVEDIDENAEITADLLELEGAETERAENGRIGLDMFRNADSNYYDAVLMDLRMPEMDGLEATRAIRGLDRADAKTVPIIALSANAYPSDVEQSLAAGMNGHLSKPTDSDQLYGAIRQAIRQAKEGTGK